MARARSPDRDKAYELWRDSRGTKKLKDIAAELGLPDSRIRKWKTEDKWDAKLKGTLPNKKRSAPKRGAPIGNRNSVGHGAPRGNKNALGNPGGGAPPGNKNAVTTGEHETIWMDCLTEEEQALCRQINTDKAAQLEEEIVLITIRERRMLQRIDNLMKGLTEKQRKVLQELQARKKSITVYDEATSTTNTVVLPVFEMVVKSIEETEYRAIDDIMRIEEALTRVQDKKAKLLQMKHEFDKGKPPGQTNIQDYIDALQGTAADAWAGEPGDDE